MNQISEVFLSILRSALAGEPARLSRELTEADWQTLARMAAAHKVLPLFLEATHTLPDAQPFLSGLKGTVRHQVMVQALKTHEFLELYNKLSSAGIRPLVVKGIVCRCLYPKADHRISSDEDLLVKPEEFDRARELLAELGMTPLPHNPDANEIPYVKQGGNLYIELHRELFPPAEDAYGSWNRYFSGIFDRAVSVSIEGTDILTPEPTEHLFYLIAHALKHFLHSGFGVRQICDIVVFANTHGPLIHWDRLWTLCGQLHARDFTAAVFRIGRDYLTFDPELARYSSQWQNLAPDPVPMLEDLLSAGVYGTASKSRLHSSSITLQAVEEGNRGEAPSPSLRRALFPPAKKLEAAYPYLNTHPWLLPLAWFQRVVRYGSETGKEADSSALEAMKIGKKRVKLLRLYRVIPSAFPKKDKN